LETNVQRYSLANDDKRQNRLYKTRNKQGYIYLPIPKKQRGLQHLASGVPGKRPRHGVVSRCGDGESVMT
jgi:hypothetical protein